MDFDVATPQTPVMISPHYMPHLSSRIYALIATTIYHHHHNHIPIHRDIASASNMENLTASHGAGSLFPRPPPHPSTKTPHIVSDIPTMKTKCSHHQKTPPKAPPTAISGALSFAIPNEFYLIGCIAMSPYPCNDPSCGSESRLPGYIVEEL